MVRVVIVQILMLDANISRNIARGACRILGQGGQFKGVGFLVTSGIIRILGGTIFQKFYKIFEKILQIFSKNPKEFHKIQRNS